MIQNNQCASGSRNVWAPEGGLTKAPGYSIGASFTATAAFGSLFGFVADDAVSTANKLFYRLNTTATGGGSGFYPWGSSNVLTDSLTPLGYVTGTISISGANLISATGSGTAWASNLAANDRIQVPASGSGWYTVSSVEDDTHLTLAAAVPAFVATGTTYVAQTGMTFKEFAQGSLNGNFCTTTTGDTFQYYDGTGMHRLSSGPSCAYLQVHKNYMFGLRVSTAFQSRLIWSAIKDPLTWPANNFIDIDVLNGKGSGLYSYGSELLVFKTRGIYKVIGDVFDPSNPQYYVIKINTPPDFMFNSAQSIGLHTGPVTYASYTANGQAVVFYAMGRIYKYITGTSYIVDISPSILRDLPVAFGTLTDSMANVDQNIRAVSYNGNYIISGLQDPNNAGKFMSLMLDQKGSWWYMSNRNATTNTGVFADGPWAVVPGTSTRPTLAVAGSTYPKIFTVDLIGPSFGTNYIDNASNPIGQGSSIAIDAKWVSKEFNIEYGTFKWIVVYLKKQAAGSLTVSWSIDQAANVSQAVDMTTGRGQVIRSVIPINQKGSTIQITLADNTVSQTFKVYAVKIYYEESPMERIA